MIWVTGGLEKQREDIGQVSAPGFLVDGALVEVVAAATFGVDSVHVDYR